MLLIAEQTVLWYGRVDSRRRRMGSGGRVLATHSWWSLRTSVVIDSNERDVRTICRVSRIMSLRIAWAIGLNYILLWWALNRLAQVRWRRTVLSENQLCGGGRRVIMRRRRLSIWDFNQSIGRPIWHLLCGIQCSPNQRGVRPSPKLRSLICTKSHVPPVRSLGLSSCDDVQFIVGELLPVS